MKSFIFFIFILSLINLLAAQVYDDDQRVDICDETLKECIQACYCQEKEKPSTNKCDPKTFNFQCVCKKGYIPPTANTTFRAFYATCNINSANCRDNCKGDAKCAQGCEEKFKCLPSADSNTGCKVNDNSNSTTQKAQSAETATSTSAKKLYEQTSSAFYINSSAYTALFLVLGVAASFLSV